MSDINDLSRYLDSTGWAGVGVVGVLLFVLGVYEPALATLPEGGYIGIGVAIAGGAIAVMGFGFAYDRREYERRHPKRATPRAGQRQVEIAPSLEIYHPGAVVDTEASLPPSVRQPALPAGDEPPPHD